MARKTQKIAGAVVCPRYYSLSVEGHAIGAFLDRGIGLVCADLDVLQRTEVFAAAVILALLDCAFNRTVCAAMTIHDFFLLHPVSDLVCSDERNLLKEKFDTDTQIAYNMSGGSARTEFPAAALYSMLLRYLMIKVSPSILSADFVNLERDIRALTPAGADYVHVDVMDGEFVPNITIGIPVVAAIRKITDLPLDVHLMIDRPIRYVDDFCKAGSDILTVHVEADTEENTLTALKRIRENGVKPAISVKPKTPAEAVLPYLPYCDLILVMTVEPGFGGQSFMIDMMPKLKQIRSYIDAQNPSCELEVDGGVNETTAMICRENGANVLVAGSAYFKAEVSAKFVAAVKK